MENFLFVETFQLISEQEILELEYYYEIIGPRYWSSTATNITKKENKRYISSDWRTQYLAQKVESEDDQASISNY